MTNHAVPGGLETAGIVATGEMGSAVARVLRHGGMRVVTALDGRSSRTQALAAASGAEDLGTVAEVAKAADVILSIVPPGQAEAVAAETAEALRGTGRRLLYLECNAVAPATAMRLGERLVEVEATFVDAGIIGFPPQPGPQVTRFYVSGPEAEQALELNGRGLDVRLVGPAVGQASGLKMCYAALTKGFTALGVASLTTATRAGLADQLLTELALSQPALLPWLQRMLGSSPPKSRRWIAEMEEIAATFDARGLGADLFLAVAEIYRALGATPVGQETPEARSERSIGELGGQLASTLPPVAPTGAPGAAR